MSISRLHYNLKFTCKTMGMEYEIPVIHKKGEPTMVIIALAISQLSKEDKQKLISDLGLTNIQLTELK